MQNGKIMSINFIKQQVMLSHFVHIEPMSIELLKQAFYKLCCVTLCINARLLCASSLFIIVCVFTCETICIMTTYCSPGISFTKYCTHQNNKIITDPQNRICILHTNKYIYYVYFKQNMCLWANAYICILLGSHQIFIRNENWEI